MSSNSPASSLRVVSAETTTVLADSSVLTKSCGSVSGVEGVIFARWGTPSTADSTNVSKFPSVLVTRSFSGAWTSEVGAALRSIGLGQVGEIVGVSSTSNSLEPGMATTAWGSTKRPPANWLIINSMASSLGRSVSDVSASVTPSVVSADWPSQNGAGISTSTSGSGRKSGLFERAFGSVFVTPSPAADLPGGGSAPGGPMGGDPSDWFWTCASASSKPGSA